MSSSLLLKAEPVPKLEHGAQGLDHWGQKIFIDGNFAAYLDTPLLCLTAITDFFFFPHVWNWNFPSCNVWPFHLVLCPGPLYLWGGSRSLQRPEGGNLMSPLSLHFWEQAQQSQICDPLMPCVPAPFSCLPYPSDVSWLLQGIWGAVGTGVTLHEGVLLLLNW